MNIIIMLVIGLPSFILIALAIHGWIQERERADAQILDYDKSQIEFDITFEPVNRQKEPRL